MLVPCKSHFKIKMLFQFLLMVTLLSSSSVVYAQWTTQKSGVTVDLYDVCFVDSLHGWIVGDSVTILATTDGGENWVKQHSELEGHRWIESNLEFINKEKGFCGGADGQLLSTTDGGNTWVKNDFGYIQHISDIEFVDENNGWIAAWIIGPDTDKGLILHTENGGDSWEIQLEDTIGYYQFREIEFLDDTTGWAMGGYYFDNFDGVDFYYTNDGGVNWDKVGSFDHGPLTILKIASKDTLWAGGYGWFSISTNGGKTWDEQQMEPSNNNRCFAPINGNEGWICQSNFTEQRNEIYYTNDGRTTWSQDYLPEKSILEMTTVGKNYLWAVGSDGNIIKRYGVPTSIQDIENVLENFYLSQNYPNPFNPNTTISYSLPQSGFVQLKVYDMLGCEVASLVNEEQAIGNYKIEFIASNLSSGVYFYRLQSGGYVETKKLILLR